MVRLTNRDDALGALPTYYALTATTLVCRGDGTTTRTRRYHVAGSLALWVTACATPEASFERKPEAVPEPASAGPVLVTAEKLPEGARFRVLGKVLPGAKGGYDAGATLYPLLAAEARKLGANAVVEVWGMRRPTMLRAAAYVEGTAVLVQDSEVLGRPKGTNH